MKIKKICSHFSSGKSISSEKIFEVGKYPVYGGNGIRGYTDNYNFDGECAVIGRQGAYCGNVKFFSGRGYMTEHAIVAVGNEISNTRFLAYKFGLMNFGRYAGQSAQLGLSVEMLANLKIDLPPLETQNKIAALLGALDDKITLNKKINATLEAMAKTLYMHKFFRKLPTGKLGEVVVENQKSTIPVGEAKSIGGEFPFFTSGDSILSWTDPLVDGRNIFLNTGGNAGIKFYVGKAAYSTDTWSISASNELTDYIYLLLKVIEPELDKKFFQGTGLRHLQRPLLKERAIYIPTEAELEKFNSIVQPCFAKISANVRENRRLAELRDWLLPMLMNGQVNFKEIDDTMDRATFMNKYWRYYLLLEKKFIDTLNYVELDEKNFSTYSVEYAHQLLAIGSELDTFFKIYCGFNLEGSRKTIADYTRYIIRDYPQITTQSVEICNTEITLTPYEEWSQRSPQSRNLLSWWKAYNLVKHNRQENITKASMRNVVTALAALHLIEMKYLQVITKENHEPDEPESSSNLFALTDWKFNLKLVDHIWSKA